MELITELKILFFLAKLVTLFVENESDSFGLYFFFFF